VGLPRTDLTTVASLATDRSLRPAGRVAVIGDLGGHLAELRSEVSRLGGDPDAARLPEDLTVIQVGDLVHRGPASVEVISLVDRFLTNQPGQWIQLVGNHEAQYLRRRPTFDWPEHIGDDAVEVLRRWWALGQMQAAAAVVTSEESFLVTHAGLTEAFWRRILDAPTGAAAAAAGINALIGVREDLLFRTGQMLGGGRGEPATGPVWAATSTELVPGWLTTPMPFSQVHGHASVFDWRSRQYRTTDEIARLTSVDEAAKHETVTVGGSRIIGVDPGHGDQARQPWKSWQVDGAVVVDNGQGQGAP